MAIAEGVICGWPSTAGTIPSPGWSRVTTLDGAHLRAVPDDTTDPGTSTGGASHNHAADSHNHTLAHTHITGGNTAAGSGSATHASSAGVDSQTNLTHTHTVGVVASSTDTSGNTAPTSDDVNLDPARWDTIWIESDGTPTQIPEGAITFWNNATLPPSWTQPANGKNRFLRGAAAAGDGGSTGGGSDHTHVGGSHHHSSAHVHPSGTSGAGGNVSNNAAGSTEVAGDQHTHGYDVVSGDFGDSQDGALTQSGTATAANVEPPWVKLAVIAAPASAGVPIGLIAVWLGTLGSIPSGWQLCDGTNGTPSLCQGRYLKGCDALSELLTTGGATSHTHTGASHTHSWSSTAHTHTLTVNATSNIVGGSGAAITASSPGHTHATTTSSAASAVTVGNATPALNAGSNLPAGIEVALIQYLGGGAAWREDANTATTIDVTGGNVQVRCRIGIQNTGTGTGVTGFKWQYALNGGTWTDITSTSSVVKTFATSHYADGDDVPQLLTAGSYQSDNNAAEASTGTFTLTAGLAGQTYVESEIALEFIQADLSAADVVTCRLVRSDGTVLNTYSQVASATIAAATLMALESAFFRRIRGRVFSRVN